MTQLYLSEVDRPVLGPHRVDGKWRVRIAAGFEAEEVSLLRFKAPGSCDHDDPIRLDCEGQLIPGVNCFAAEVPQARTGDEYGLRVRGPFAPDLGFRYDECKLLSDPAALLGSAHFVEHDALYSVEKQTGVRNFADSMPFASRTVFYDGNDDGKFDWEDDAPVVPDPGDMVIYEGHARSVTIKVSADLLNAKPGTYAAIGSDWFLDYLCRLGVNTLELYCVQYRPMPKGGYWGYDPLLPGAVALHYGTNPLDPLATGREFKAMVKKLHRRGIRVVLDLVFNHTCEGDHRGPTLSLKGLYNKAYRLCGQNGALNFYWNGSGCGNALDFEEPFVQQLYQQALVSWRRVWHIDGVRFDLGGIQHGGRGGYYDENPFGRRMKAHPVIAAMEPHIYEPWIGNGNNLYQVPPRPGRAVWHAEGRDAFRLFARGDHGSLGKMIAVLTGSRLFFPPAECGDYPAVAYITSHDGFNFAQRLLHNHKSNDDGHDNELSWDCGNDPALRWRIYKMSMALLLFSPLPMIRAGDEVLYYPGNADNNPYDEGDEVNGVDLLHSCGAAYEYCRGILALRRRHPTLGRMFFDTPPYGCYTSCGCPMGNTTWNTAKIMETSLLLPGSGAKIPQRGESADLLLMINGYHEGSCTMQVPHPARGTRWVRVLQTDLDEPFAEHALEKQEMSLPYRSAALLVAR